MDMVRLQHALRATKLQVTNEYGVYGLALHQVGQRRCRCSVLLCDEPAIGEMALHFNAMRTDDDVARELKMQYALADVRHLLRERISMIAV